MIAKKRDARKKKKAEEIDKDIDESNKVKKNENNSDGDDSSVCSDVYCVSFIFVGLSCIFLFLGGGDSLTVTETLVFNMKITSNYYFKLKRMRKLKRVKCNFHRNICN